MITTRDVAGRRRRSAARRTRGCPATCRQGDPILIDDGKVRLRVDQGRRHRRHDPGRGRRQGQRPQGHQPARRGGQRARAVGEGHGRPALGAATSRRLHRAVLRALAPPTSSDVRADHARGGRACSRSSPRSRSRRRSTTSTRSSTAFDAFMVARGDLGVECPLEDVPFLQKRVDRQGPPQRQAGDRGDPDARVDDHQPAARPAPRPPTSRTRSSTAPTR